MDTRDIADAFNARAAGYAQDNWHRRYAEALVSVTPLRPGDHVLDAGTGTGFAACSIARRIGPGGHVVGVDLSPGMLDRARSLIDAEQLPNVELVEADATDLRNVSASTFDAVVCSAGLLYMPVTQALSAWYRLLKPNGVVAFSTMRAGSPATGRIFRECAARFGLNLKDPSAALGSEDRCRSALEAAGFEGIRVIGGSVDFERLDPSLAWEANLRSAKHRAVGTLSAEQQAALREQYIRALEEAQQTDLAATAAVNVLYAIGHRAGASGVS
jgi:ubiquinone/menaquinone biosynthesis C-methylase UbiE